MTRHDLQWIILDLDSEAVFERRIYSILFVVFLVYFEVRDVAHGDLVIRILRGALDPNLLH